MIEILFITVIISVILFVIYRLNSYKPKGDIGESIVAKELDKLQGEEYKVFNDILIKTSKGSCQIDHIVVSIYGIFVIETKNYSGWIHGNEKSEYWTQSVYENKTKFRNPVKQNWAHIYALKEIFSDFKQVNYHPIVVFTGNAELKNIYSKIPVIYEYQLVQTIMDKNEIRNLSVEQMKNIADKLSKVNIKDKNAKKEHIYHVQKLRYEWEKNENSLICPKCGGTLVIRDGRYGKFYGCSHYPKCKYTLSYEKE